MLMLMLMMTPKYLQTFRPIITTLDLKFNTSTMAQPTDELQIFIDLQNKQLDLMTLVLMLLKE